MTELERILSELHEAVADDLLVRIQSGTATAAELTAAIKFLKDNNITIPAPEVDEEEESAIESLAKYLPALLESDEVPNANGIKY